jgi:hypothetical protein
VAGNLSLRTPQPGHGAAADVDAERRIKRCRVVPEVRRTPAIIRLNSVVASALVRPNSWQEIFDKTDW